MRVTFALRLKVSDGNDDFRRCVCSRDSHGQDCRGREDSERASHLAGLPQAGVGVNKLIRSFGIDRSTKWTY
jgi:hypothetical protein